VPGADASQQARYVAIITDGNGRWAQGRGLPLVAGHLPRIAEQRDLLGLELVYARNT